MGRVDWDLQHPLDGAHHLKRRALENAHRRTVAAQKAGDPYVFRAVRGRRYWMWRVVRGTVQPTPDDESLNLHVNPADGEPGQGSDTINVTKP